MSNSNYDKVPAHLIEIKYITKRIKKVASPITALHMPHLRSLFE